MQDALQPSPEVASVVSFINMKLKWPVKKEISAKQIGKNTFLLSINPSWKYTVGMGQDVENIPGVDKAKLDLIADRFESKEEFLKFIDEFQDHPDYADIMKKFSDNPDLVDAWKLMKNNGVDDTIRKNLGEVEKVANNIVDVKDLGYDLWKKIDDLDYTDALTHLHERVPARRRKGIVGCHNEDVFFDQNIIRTKDASSLPNYKPEAGKLKDEVEEYVITRNVQHPDIPGVKIVEYKYPALTDGNPNYTTGLLKVPDNGGIKTIFDPKVWPDSRLDKAVKEAVNDYAKKNKKLENGRAMLGETSEGYLMEFRIRNGKVETYYFQ